MSQSTNSVLNNNQGFRRPELECYTYGEDPGEPDFAYECLVWVLSPTVCDLSQKNGKGNGKNKKEIEKESDEAM